MSDPSHIRGWQRLSDDVTTSGKLTAKDPCELADLGVRSVLDLAPSDHADGLKDEERILTDLGIRFGRIPVAFDAPAEEDYQTFRRMFECSDRPIHVHCIANHRVSAFLYRYHLETGMAEIDARRLMRQQWEPDASDHPMAAPWKEFVETAKQAQAPTAGFAEGEE